MQFKGFTLIELLVVVSIIAILIVIGIAVYSGVQKNARDTKRKQDIDAISKALEARNTNGNYLTVDPTWFVNPDTPPGELQLLKDPMDPDATGCDGKPCRYCFRNDANYCTNDATSSTTNTAGPTYTVCANLESGGYYCMSSQQ